MVTSPATFPLIMRRAEFKEQVTRLITLTGKVYIEELHRIRQHFVTVQNPTPAVLVCCTKTVGQAYCRILYNSSTSYDILTAH